MRGTPPRARARAAGRPGPRPSSAAVMAATTWLLLNEGYAATTLEAVARRAGMAKKPFTVMPATARTWWPRSCGWTDGFAPVMAQDVTSVDEVLPALARVLQAIAERCRPTRSACSAC